MKKLIPIALAFFAAYCSSKKTDDISIPNLEGEWGDCNGYSDCIIHVEKKGKIFTLSSDNGIYTLEKKSTDLYVGHGGLVTLIYDDPPRIKKNPKRKEEMLEMAEKTKDPEKRKEILSEVSKRWILSGVCNGAVELCRHSEVSRNRNPEFNNNEILLYSAMRSPKNKLSFKGL